MKSLGLAAKQKFLLISTTSSSTEFSTGAELRRFLIFSIKREMPVLISLPMFILMRLGPAALRHCIRREILPILMKRTIY